MEPGKSTSVRSRLEWLLTESFKCESGHAQHNSKGRSKEELHVTELETRKFEEAGNVTKGFLYVV
jgi:hypothetical protein